jgi:hypothetical protein
VYEAVIDADDGLGIYGVDCCYLMHWRYDSLLPLASYFSGVSPAGIELVAVSLYGLGIPYFVIWGQGQLFLEVKVLNFCL